MTRMLLWTVLLTIVYALALGSFAPWDLLLGAVVSAVLVVTLRRGAVGVPGQGLGLLERLVRLPALTAAVLRDMTVGTWQVASTVIGPRRPHPGIVVVPIGERSDAGALVTAFLSTLSPGEFLVDIDWEEGVMLFHVLGARDPGEVRARFADFYRRHQQRIVP